jgi:hypothetical protein
MNDQPNPCPFCGNAEVQLEELDAHCHAVTCDSCGCHGPVSGLAAEAEDGWNFRHYPIGEHCETPYHAHP